MLSLSEVRSCAYDLARAPQGVINPLNVLASRALLTPLLSIVGFCLELVLRCKEHASYILVEGVRYIAQWIQL